MKSSLTGDAVDGGGRGRWRGGPGPELSFVVIAYNEAPNIERCLRSILAQEDLGQAEILVVDDGSTDGTGGIAEAVGAETPTLRVLRSADNRGRGAARARGVAAARGDLIAMVDGDIVLPPQWLCETRAALRGYDAVGGVAVPDGDATYLCRRFGLVPRPRPHTVAVTGNNGLYRREVFERAPIDPGLPDGEDVALVKAMETAGMHVRSLPALTVEHRESKGFGRSVRWLYESGVGATRQYRRYHELRAPDLAFGVCCACTVAAWVLSAPRLRLGTSVAVSAATCTCVAAAHTVTRFQLRRSDVGRLAAATAADTALVGAYMVGRLAGLARLGR